MRLLLKRDDTGEGFPSPDQVAVGELVINSKTGKLYSKLVDGSIVEWIGQKICFEPTPEITFMYNNQIVSNIDNLCCAGDNILVVVKKLKLEPFLYSYDLIELTQNSSSEQVNISDAQYTTYNETVDGETKTYRQAIIPINLSINSNAYNNLSIFKFVLYDSNNSIISEQIITFKCVEASL